MCQNLPGIDMYVQELVGSGFWSCSCELTPVKTVPHGFCLPHLTTPLERLPKTCFEALEQTNLQSSSTLISRLKV